MKGKLVWKGFFEGNTGYIKSTCAYVKALQGIGADIGIQPLSPLSEKNPLKSLVIKDKTNTFTICHQTPSLCPKEEAYYTVYEFNVAPPEWWKSLDEAKLILTQSKFCKSVFSKIPEIDSSKIHIVNFPITDPSIKPDGTVMRTEKNYDFLFGSVFQWVARKRPDIMWKAFQEEFPLKEYPNVGFINRISLPQGMTNWKYWFNEFTNRDPRITVIDQDIPQIGDFYRGLDCYCSPTAGEGWGITLAEAMACGIPTIGSRHSGNLDFMNDTNSYLVDCDKWSYIGDEKLNRLSMIHPFQKWRLPKVESIRKVMRLIYEKKSSGVTDKRAIEGIKIKETYSPYEIANQIMRALETVD